MADDDDDELEKQKDKIKKSPWKKRKQY